MSPNYLAQGRLISPASDSVGGFLEGFLGGQKIQEEEIKNAILQRKMEQDIGQQNALRTIAQQSGQPLIEFNPEMAIRLQKAPGEISQQQLDTLTKANTYYDSVVDMINTPEQYAGVYEQLKQITPLVISHMRHPSEVTSGNLRETLDTGRLYSAQIKALATGHLTPQQRLQLETLKEQNKTTEILKRKEYEYNLKKDLKDYEEGKPTGRVKQVDDYLKKYEKPAGPNGKYTEQQFKAAHNFIFTKEIKPYTQTETQFGIPTKTIIRTPGIQPPQGTDWMDSLPDAGANKGRTIEDSSGKRYKSDGKNWMPQ